MRRWLPALLLGWGCAHAATECPQPARVQLRQPVAELAAPVDEPGRNTSLRHTLLAHGRDGYAVALAIGELDPHMAGKQVIVPMPRTASRSRP